MIVLKIYYLLEISKINFFEGKLNPNSGNVNNSYNVSTNPNANYNSNANANAYKESPMTRPNKKDNTNLNSISLINSNSNQLTTHNNTSSDTYTILNKINNSDCNELSFRIYKMLFDEDMNEIKIKELDYLTNLILSEYIVTKDKEKDKDKDNFISFDKFTNIIEGVTNTNTNSTTTSNNMKAILNLKITFENFLK